MHYRSFLKPSHENRNRSQIPEGSYTGAGVSTLILRDWPGQFQCQPKETQKRFDRYYDRAKR